MSKLNANVSIGMKDSRKMTKYLSQCLADTYTLYTKTQNFHWNLIDPRFYSLHVLFEKQYEELAEALDVIAERIRMLGVESPGSMKEFLSLSALKEAKGQYTGNEMIQQLLEDHEAMATMIRPEIKKSTDLHDEGTADMLIARIRAHEKAAWMLRSHL